MNFAWKPTRILGSTNLEKRILSRPESTPVQFTPQVVPLKPLEPPYPRSYDPNGRCNYHGGALGHATKRCWSLKHKVQDLLDDKLLGFEDKGPNVHSNHLPTHGATTVNTISHMDERVPARPVYNNNAVPWKYPPEEPQAPQIRKETIVPKIINIAAAVGMTPMNMRCWTNCTKCQREFRSYRCWSTRKVTENSS
ncbi:hypothetical protein CR513_27309, partial [Mucuna pruriens]